MKSISKTAHFVIRQFASNERVIFFNLFTDNRLTKYLPERSADQVIEMFESILDGYKKNPELGMWGVFAPNGEFIGFAMLRADEANMTNGVLGYTLHYKFWNRGLATFIAKTLVGYGFNQQRLSAILAVTVPENIASIRVLEKVGLKRIGTIEKDGALLDEYRITKEKSQ